MNFQQQALMNTILFSLASGSGFSPALGGFETDTRKHYIHCTCGKCTSKRRARKTKNKMRKQSRRKNR